MIIPAAVDTEIIPPDGATGALCRFFASAVPMLNPRHTSTAIKSLVMEPPDSVNDPENLPG